MKREKKYSIFTYFLSFLILLALVYLPLTNVNATSPYRYHAGYFYYGFSSTAPEGVKANIYTKNTGIPPWLEFMAQWDTVILSYSSNYWVQLGYAIHWAWFIFPYATVDFFKEKVDSNGRSFSYLALLKPLFDHTYTYKLLLTESGEYTYYVHEGSTLIYSGTMSVNPYVSKDLQAFVETTHTLIIITGSHFSSLRYRQTSTSWPLWDRHYPWDDPPYSVNEMGHSEFTTSGGG
jgi:hypothetical protein